VNLSLLLELLSIVDARRNVIADVIDACRAGTREPTPDELATIRQATRDLEAEWAALAPPAPAATPPKGDAQP
jgi:hypothetical protein